MYTPCTQHHNSLDYFDMYMKQEAAVMIIFWDPKLKIHVSLFEVFFND